MSRLVIPEFEEGEEIKSSQFNEINDALAELKIDESNITNEAINKDLVKDRTVFSSPKSSSFSEITITGEKKRTYTTWRSTNQNWINKKSITLQDISSTDKILVRASCRITLPDYGFKTFFDGSNPIISMMLRYRFNSSASDSDDANWQNLPQTHQQFSLAFGGKIASDSSLSFLTCQTVGGSVRVDDVTYTLEGFFTNKHFGRGLNESRTNTGTALTTSAEHRDTTDPNEFGPRRYSLSHRDSQPFEMSVDYTAAHLLDPLIDYDNVEFAVWGSHSNWAANGGDTLVGGSKANGCSTPDFFGFTVSDFNLYGYKIQK